MFEDAGQELDGDEQGHGGPSGDDATDWVGVGGGDVGGEAADCAEGQRCPGQPVGPASCSTVGEQDKRGDDLDAVDRQREGMSMPPGLVVCSGDLAPVAATDSAGDSRERGRSLGNPADPPVSQTDLGCGRRSSSGGLRIA